VQCQCLTGAQIFRVVYTGCCTGTVAAVFIVTLRYVADLVAINAALPEHVAWLERQYAAGMFLASGRQVPRTGGIILTAHTSRADLEQCLKLDPFNRQGLAEYTIVEFIPSRVPAGLERLQL
jgi:uncharacterized protein YciI